MKKTVRILAFALASVMILLSLSSCKMLDEAKANQMKFTDDTESTVIFRGEKYLKLADTRYSFASDFEYYYMGDNSSYMLTELDVPVLVAGMFGHSAEYNSKFGIIKGEGFTKELENGIEYGSTAYYCREDKFDEYSRELEDPEFVNLALLTDVHDADYRYFGSEFAEFPDDARNDFELAVGGKASISGDLFDAFLVKSYSVCEVYKTSKSGLLVDPASIEIYDFNGTYYAAYLDASMAFVLPDSVKDTIDELYGNNGMEPMTPGY